MSVSAQCPSMTWDRQVPRAPLHNAGVTLVVDGSCPPSRSVTSSSLLIRAHAPDQDPPSPFRLQRLIGPGLCRLLPVPAGNWSFPTLSLRVLPSMSGSVPRRPARCSCPFLPLRLRPSLPSACRSADTNLHLKQLRVVSPFGAVIIRIPLQTSRFACHPGCPHPPGRTMDFAGLLANISVAVCFRSL